MAQLASWPLQLDLQLNNIKETFGLLSQELDVTRQELDVIQHERDDYKAQLDAKSKELDDFRRLVDLRGATFENDEQAASPVTSEYYSPVDEVSVADGNQESDWYGDGESAGSLLDDSNNKATSELVYTLHESGGIRNVIFSPDGKFLATVCLDEVKIYETETGNNVSILFDCYLADKYTHTKNPLELGTACFSPDNKYLATTGLDYKIRIWDIGKKGIRNISKGQGNSILPGSLDFVSRGRFIALASADSKVRLWNMRTGTPTIFEGSGVSIWSVRSSPDGRYIAAGSNGMVLIWDIRSRGLVNCSLQHPGVVNGIDFTQDGTRLVTGSVSDGLKLWDISVLKLAEQPGLGQQQDRIVNGVQCLRSFDDAGNVWSIALSRDGQWVLSGSWGGGHSVSVWDMCNGKRQCILPVGRESDSLVACSPVGDYFVVASLTHVSLYAYRMI